MKRMNQKGITSIELLVSFILISTIVVSMFNMIMNYKNEEQIESIENQVIQYENNLQKLLQDDFIKKNLVSVQLTDDKNAIFQFLDGSTTQLQITPTVVSEEEDVLERGKIQYGESSSMLEYAIPNIADLTLTEDSKVLIDGEFVQITLYLEHPNFEQPYRVRITSPISYNNG